METARGIGIESVSSAKEKVDLAGEIRPLSRLENLVEFSKEVREDRPDRGGVGIMRGWRMGIIELYLSTDSSRIVFEDGLYAARKPEVVYWQSEMPACEKETCSNACTECTDQVRNAGAVDEVNKVRSA